MRERPGPKMIEASKIVIPETERVFGSLQDVRSGVKIAPDLLARTLRGDIKRIVVAGLPANGKTVNTLQLISSFLSNAKRLGVENEVILSQYDSFLNGKDDDTKEFNLRMYRSVRAREYANPDALSVVEVPAVGMTDIKDRGVTFMELIAADSHVRNDTTAFVYLVENGPVQTRGSYLRAEINELGSGTPDLRVRNEEIIHYLEQHGLHLINVPENLGTYTDLQEQFSKMAQLPHIKAISQEMQAVVSDYAQFSSEEYRGNVARVLNIPISHLDMLKVMEEFKIPATTDQEIMQVEHMAQKWIRNSRDQAAYYMGRLNKLEVPERNSYIVLNPFSQSRLQLDYSIYTQQGLPNVS